MPHQIDFNWVSILAAAVVHFVIGALWYSPILFVRPFQALTGVSDADMKASLPKGMIGGVVISLVIAFVLYHAVKYSGANTLGGGVMVGFFNWLGFVATVLFQGVLWAKQPLKLYAITAGAELLSLLVMGGLIAAWG